MNLISAPKMGKSWLVTDSPVHRYGPRLVGAIPLRTRRRTDPGQRAAPGDQRPNRIPKVANARGIPIDAYADQVWVEHAVAFRTFLAGQLLPFAHAWTVQGDHPRCLLPVHARDMDENDNGTMASLSTTLTATPTCWVAVLS